MTTNEYLHKVLASQTLANGSQELNTLQEHRADVEYVLHDHFDDCSPTIRYGGSKAKGTMIRESYDLDIVCYFPHEDTAAGKTLKDIYENMRSALQEKYLVESKTSSLRLKKADPNNRGVDFYIDVVPGRFTDDKRSDTFLYQAGSEKDRLKTNIDVHIAHVRESKVTDAVRLIKLWKVRNGITLKTFVLELVVIKLLKDKKGSNLDTQLEHVWTEFRDNIDHLTVEDPANPGGNDLSGTLNASKPTLPSVAQRTLALIDSAGWEAVYGPVDDKSGEDRTIGLRRIAASVATPSRPWCRNAS